MWLKIRVETLQKGSDFSGNFEQLEDRANRGKRQGQMVSGLQGSRGLITPNASRFGGLNK